MNSRTARLMSKTALVLALAGIVAAPTETWGATYYATKMSLKLALQNDEHLDVGRRDIAIMRQTQRALINLARNFDLNTRITDSNIVLAMRLDDCATATGQLVVYNKATTLELANVSESFAVPVSPLLKQRHDEMLAAKFVAVANVVPSGPNDNALNGGTLVLSLNTTRRVNAAADACPDSVTGSLLGFVNVSFIDHVDGLDIPVTTDALILNGSTLVAKRIRP